MSSASCPPLVRRHALRAATTATAVRARCAAWAENRSPTKSPLLETDRCIVVAAGRCGVLPIVWCASHRAVCSPSCGVLRDSVSRIQRIVRARDTGICVVRMVCAYLAGVEYFPRNLKPHCANAAAQTRAICTSKKIRIVVPFRAEISVLVKSNVALCSHTVFFWTQNMQCFCRPNKCNLF